MDDGQAALAALLKDADDSARDIAEMEKAVQDQNRRLIAHDAALREDMAMLRDEIQRLTRELESYKKHLLEYVEAFRQAVHNEQIDTLRKHIDALGFEKALHRRQVRKIISEELNE